ncbi:MAG: hypothetical protein H7335_13905 [Massilia sp.]|nr:hypothetical protein [Massilia sp.]
MLVLAVAGVAGAMLLDHQGVTPRALARHAAPPALIAMQAGISAQAQGDVLRAEAPGQALLEFDLVEGLVVSAPYWRFQGLSIRGACANDSHCEHA